MCAHSMSIGRQIDLHRTIPDPPIYPQESIPNPPIELLMIDHDITHDFSPLDATLIDVAYVPDAVILGERRAAYVP